MNLLQTLEALCGENAPSGFEAPAARVAAELLAPLVDEVYTDPMGSVVGVRRCGRPEAAKLLLKRIESQSLDEPPRGIKMDGSLVVRHSTVADIQVDDNLADW